MKKIKRLEKELQSNKKEIEELESFRSTKQVNQLRRQLFAEQSELKRDISKLNVTKEQKERSREERRKIANKNRSEKMKRSFRYFKAIQTNFFPEKSTKEIRSSFSKHSRGMETDISDIIWRNPSP